MKRRAEELWGLSAPELRRCLVEGDGLDPDRLAGANYRGVSLGLPRFVERLTWKTFRKTFRRGADGELSGLNVRMEQTGLDGPSVPMRDSAGRELTFGPFAICALPPHGTPFGCTRGVVFDYAQRHPAWHPVGRTRDVVVALDDDLELLLGALYVEVAGVGVRTPSYFTLEREA